MITPTLYQNLKTIQALVAADQTLNEPVVMLYSNSLTPDANTVYNDLGVIEDAWANEQAITFLDAYIQVNGTAVLQGQALEFQTSGITETVTVRGYAVLQPESSFLHLIYCENFENPITLTSDDQALVFAPQLKFGNPEDTGTATVLS